MLRSKILCISYLLIGMTSVLLLYNTEKSFSMEVENNFSVTYLTNVTGVSVYQKGEYNNEMKCNLTTINNIIRNMISKGYYSIVKDNSEGYILDIILEKDDEYYRILYNRRTRDYMCLSNPNLKNYIPVTYINE